MVLADWIGSNDPLFSIVLSSRPSPYFPLPHVTSRLSSFAAPSLASNPRTRHESLKTRASALDANWMLLFVSVDVLLYEVPMGEFSLSANGWK